VSVVLSPGRILAGVASAVAVPVVAHAALGAGYGHWVALAEALLVASVVVTWLLRTQRRSRAAVAAIVLAVLMLGMAAASRLPVYVPSVAVDVLLAWLFGHTLARGRQPLISRVARIDRGADLDPATLQYTRRVTFVWFLFFAVCAVSSLLLGLFASLRHWSLFANVLMLPMAMALFLGEWAYRRRRFHEREHASPLSTIAKFASASAALFESHGA
jgi:uncharacterized membrane protein